MDVPRLPDRSEVKKGLKKPCSQDQVIYPYNNLKNRCYDPHFPHRSEAYKSKGFL